MFRRRREAVPEELAFLPADEWQELARVVDDVVRRAHGRRAGSVVTLASGQLLNLGNLARTCHQLPRSDWRQEIERFVIAFASNLGDPVGDIEADRSAALCSLRVRPYAEDFVAGIADRIVHRPLAGEVVEVLCLDYPDRVAIVNDSMAAALGGSEEELLAIGLANVRQDDPPGLVERMEVEPGVVVDVFGGDSFYAATWGLWPADLAPEVGEHGALVVMPFRHQVAVHALRSEQGAILAPGWMLRLAQLGVSDGVGPVSDQLFWWRDGRLSHLPGRAFEDRVELTPSDEYVELIRELSVAASG